MSQNIKLIIIIFVILGTSFIYNKIRPEKKVVNLNKEIVYNENITNGKVNINTANLEDYLNVGINLSTAKKIDEYVKIVGKVKNINELTRISGIGEKTIKKLKDQIIIGQGGNFKKIKINTATDKEFLYFGFSKKEIKKIREFLKKHEVIYSNIELINLLGEERASDFENIINYN